MKEVGERKDQWKRTGGEKYGTGSATRRPPPEITLARHEVPVSPRPPDPRPSNNFPPRTFRGINFRQEYSHRHLVKWNSRLGLRGAGGKMVTLVDGRWWGGGGFVGDGVRESPRQVFVVLAGVFTVITFSYTRDIVGPEEEEEQEVKEGF
ncbi:hypothetical protein E2C01_007445 [Portunus trituberculatus]|uniref:Uncharacterized protein n=1 Tax=Portunus trituberculatus TaxID=210409 RepID=A0A5B7D4A0_PORTR|nr:hypothetical protein [Portunus trituberculatus]